MREAAAIELLCGMALLLALCAPLLLAFLYSRGWAAVFHATASKTGGGRARRPSGPARGPISRKPPPPPGAGRLSEDKIPARGPRSSSEEREPTISSDRISGDRVGPSFGGVRATDENPPDRSDTPPRMSGREQRFEQARRLQRLRAALSAAGPLGCYVFDELVADEAGKIDYLVVGPLAVCAVIVRDEPGVVTAAPDRTLLVDGRPLEDDPRRQASELTDDLVEKLSDFDPPIASLICFTNAELEPGDNPSLMRGTCTLWTLSWNLDPEGEEELTAADIEELAERIEQAYGRPPFVSPVPPTQGGR